MSTVASTLGQVKFATRDFVPTNIDNMVKYERVFNFEYRASADGETVIGIVWPPIPNAVDTFKRIIRIDRNVQPWDNWSYNTSSFALTLTNGDNLAANEILNIIYAVVVNA